MSFWVNRRPRLFTGGAASRQKYTSRFRCTGEDAYTPKLTTIHVKRLDF
jgi:hypothetical protein